MRPCRPWKSGASAWESFGGARGEAEPPSAPFAADPARRTRAATDRALPNGSIGMRRVRDRAPTKKPRPQGRGFAGRTNPSSHQGWSTPLMTWITPFDCITLAVVTVAVLPLASVTNTFLPRVCTVSGSP